MPNSVLFTIGYSLHKVDAHIAQAIGRSGLQAVYIGYFNASDMDRAGELAAEWALMRRAASLSPLKVYTFHTGQCDIWQVPAQENAA